LNAEVVADAEAAARRGAELIADAITGGARTLAVSGGHAPWRMFELLGERDLDWSQVTIFQVDERIAPDGDPDRNLTHLLESLPADAVERLRPMPVTDADPDGAAERYAAELGESIDLVHLGLGPDGHTASLVPGDPVLEVGDRKVAVTGEYQGRRRMTLTYPVLEAAGRILWLVTGESKVDALAMLRAGDESIPAGRVKARDAILLADRAASPG
jgi:6-phosphogluconolactonase/glucosamine-6-phosphate isomerase/deaminase